MELVVAYFMYCAVCMEILIASLEKSCGQCLCRGSNPGISNVVQKFYRSVRMKLAHIITEIPDDLLIVCHTRPVCYISSEFTMVKSQVRHKYSQTQLMYTGCPRRNVPDFGRVFLMLKYTDIASKNYHRTKTTGECGIF